MSLQTPPGYVLLDPRPIAAAAPYTYFLPDFAEIVAVAAGDLVKLNFEHVPAGVDYGVERMWVEVTAADGDDLTGVLANQPSESTAAIRLGDRVEFKRHHVIGIQWADPENAPRPSPRREYWERCLVDDCVLDGTEPVEFLYREVPDMGEEGDTYPDSGWRIRGRRGEATDEAMEAREFSTIAIGKVLNRDDSWLPFIDAPIGTGLMRDFASDTYVEEV